MVIVQVPPGAGLGNQLTSYAIARNIAYKLNAELKIEHTGYKEYRSGRHGHYRLWFFNIQAEFGIPF